VKICWREDSSEETKLQYPPFWQDSWHEGIDVMMYLLMIKIVVVRGFGLSYCIDEGESDTRLVEIDLNEIEFFRSYKFT